MASKMPCETIERKITRNHNVLFCLPKVLISSKAHNKANKIQADAYETIKNSIPNLKPITSKSGKIVEKIAANNNHFRFLLSINFVNV